MAKKFHENAIDFYNKKIPEFKKELFEREKQTDNVVVWIAGLSTAAIAFALTNNDNPIINILFLKISVGFFLLTIISATIFRSFFFNFQEKEAALILNFEGYCHGMTSETYGPITITEHHTIKQIAESLKKDMGLDYDDWLEHEYLDRNFWVEHYQIWADFWNKQEQEGIKNLAMALAPLMGKFPQEVNETVITEYDNTSQIKNFIAVKKICQLTYNGVLFSFVLAISTIAFGFFIS